MLYHCYRCLNFNGSRFSNMIYHVNNSKCNKVPYNELSDDQIFILSILQDGEVQNDDLKQFKNTHFLYDNRKDVINELSNTWKNKTNTCKNCKKSFESKISF